MVGVVPPGLGEAYVNQHIALLRPVPSINPQGLAYLLLDPGRAQGVLRKAQYGAVKAGLSLDQVRLLEVVFPPQAELERILESIDGYLSRIDESAGLLQRVHHNLRRYRASVLQSAVTGRLVPTEAELARAEGRSYEPASVLLKRILAERRRRWGESGKRGQYVEPEPPDTSGFPELPEGWCWTTLDSIAEVKGGLAKGQTRRVGSLLMEVPYLRVANVQRGRLDLSSVKTIEATEEEIAELLLVPGDVLLNEGGDRDKLGRGWVWNGELPTCIHQNHVFRARLFLGCVLPKFVSCYANSQGQAYFQSQGKQTTNLASISLSKLRRLPVAVPPTREQERILAEVEQLLSVADESSLWLASAKERCHRLRQSILKWAFEGKLVDQDPADEPASVLLERIKAEQTSMTTTGKTGPKTRPPRRRTRS